MRENRVVGVHRHGILAGSIAVLSAAVLSSGLLGPASVGLAPAGAAPTQWAQATTASPGPTANSLLGVSCTNPTSCLAVGDSVNVFTQTPLAETWNGTAWTATPTPPTPPTGGSDARNLAGVSCFASGCEAVGFSQNAAGVSQALADSWNGTTWTLQTTPATGAGDSKGDTLTGLSCQSTTSCVAVGWFTNPSGVDQALVETLSGTTWTKVLSAAQDVGTGNNRLLGVSCTSAIACVAVGYSTAPSMSHQPLIETFDGANWTVATVPVPAGSSSNGLEGVSCTGPSSCTAVGASVNGTNKTLVESLGGAGWSVVSSPSPGTANNVLKSVWCTSASDCVATGATSITSGPSDTLVESFGGAAWTQTTSPSPGTAGDALAGVWCAGPSSCVAVGAYDIGVNPSFVGQTLAEIGSTPTPPPPPPPPPTPPVPPAPTHPAGHGYWLVGGDGGIFTFGSARFYGSTGNLVLQRAVVGITPTVDDGGYWLVAGDGGLFSFGDSGFFGSIPGQGIAPAGTTGPGRHLSAPIVGMVPSADGGGYFMVGSDGGVFAFGDAHYAGSCPGIGGCDAPAVAVMPDASGNGYWVVTSVGSVYAFGDAPYLGAPAPGSAPVTSAVRTPDGKGYWVLFADGSTQNFGDAPSLGSLAGTTGGLDPATAIFPTADDTGYWIATALGAVSPFGDAPGDGGMSGQHLNAPIIAATGW
ncbi:MAG TPA: hypothetical protein VKG43_00905 [Acidimicrobiales bacterium]|nr:hypothetical protein [Acidimicrobiales bacterium]